ncbi:unnamed protein product [Fraxinus pennsylvanica]|uniref:Protein kinase domain-containing protein n=1 Tax=Fraxinus pennsylvanica TaxID=56036 RepID=A0AAD2AGK9_9LAMI|nr:unnamed protein product [Fraxinus pennsylvanica]
MDLSSNSLTGMIPKSLKALKHLTDSKLLGRGSCGSVFKGSFTDGTLFTVEVFHLQFEGAFKIFDTEYAVFCSLNHRNLAKVISSCTNHYFKGLVLEYMPNGSLETWIHSDVYFLDIIQRLNIMTDVAGMCNRVSPPQLLITSGSLGFEA